MAILVSQKLVEADEGYGKTINQLKKIFLDKEIEKRGIKDFHSAIVEMFQDGSEPKVYVDDEAIFEIEFKEAQLQPSMIGKPLALKLEDIKQIKWHAEKLDPTSGKFSIIKWNKDYWVLDFDFRYSAPVVEEKVEKTKEFLSDAKNSKGVGPKIYLLWSAYELFVDANLYRLPKQHPAPNHRDRKEKVKSNSGMFLPGFVDTFTLLSEVKNSARYGGKVDSKVNEKFIADSIELLNKSLESFRS